MSVDSAVVRAPHISIPSGWRLPLALLAVYVVWGSTYLAISFMVRTIPPLFGNGIRMLVAGIVMYLVLRRTGAAAPTPRQWRNGWIAGTLLFVGGLGQVSIAESLGVGSGVAATAVAMTPVWASLVSGLFGRWPRRNEWIGLAIGVVGVVILSREGDFAARPVALALIVAAPVMWSLGSVWSNHVDLPGGSMRTAIMMLGGGGSLMAAGVVKGETFGIPSLTSVMALLYLIVFGSLIAFSAYAFLLRTVAPSLATSYAYVNPIVAVALGISLGGETITGATWVALPLIVAGVMLIARSPRRAVVPTGAAG